MNNSMVDFVHVCVYYRLYRMKVRTRINQDTYSLILLSTSNFTTYIIND